jgi:phosphate-selective porin OprO/OprP
MTEYLAGRFERIERGSQSCDLDVDGFYLTIGYVLTGEDAARDAAIKPLNVFDPSKGGWGAWEVVGRYQILRTRNEILDLGLATGTDKAQSVTLGLNWAPNRHIRAQVNYDHAWFDDPVTVEGKPLKSEDTFTTRIQFDF